MLDVGERLLRGSIDIKFSLGGSNANQATDIQFVFSFLRHARNRVYAKQIGYLATTTRLWGDMHLFDQLLYPWLCHLTASTSPAARRSP